MEAIYVEACYEKPNALNVNGLKPESKFRNPHSLEMEFTWKRSTPRSALSLSSAITHLLFSGSMSSLDCKVWSVRLRVKVLS